MRIVITGGGTGGHLSIAKALAKECKKRGFYTLYIGGTKGQDRQWFEKDAECFDMAFFLESTPVVNQKHIYKIKALWQNITESFKALTIMKKYNIQACVSVGGFSAATGSFAAIFGRIPFFIHEQNACMGSLNRLLKPFAKIFFSSFPFQNAIITPYPVNNIFFEKQRIRKELKHILFLGGSQGAKAINEFALEIAPFLSQRNIRILHQTGKIDFDAVKSQYKKNGFQITSCFKEFCKHHNNTNMVFIFDFSDQIPLIMQMADFAISRSGASSLWELAANGLPALFIPYPYAAKNHQYFNAKILSDKGYALLYTQNVCNNYIKNLHKIATKNMALQSYNKNLESIMEERRNYDNNEDIMQHIFSLNLLEISQSLIHEIGKDGAKTIIDTIQLNIST